MGIGGAGMSAVARLLLAHGQVSGSDAGHWPLGDALLPLGVTVHDAFAARHVAGADVVVRSSAYGVTNVEVAEAERRGIPVWKRHDAWKLLAGGKRVVAVSGTHGKTTTTAMVWSALRAGGVDASLICGARLRDLGSNAHLGRDATLVIEADEYDNAFLALDPEVAVVLNVEHDHVDLFPTETAYREAFRAFARRVKPGGALVVCADDPGARGLAAVDAVTYGTSADAGYRVVPAADGHALRLPDGATVPLRPRVPGLHNVLNGAAAIAAAALLGVAPRSASEGVASFGGTERRLEELGREDDVLVVDDYAHHPSELRASIEALRPRGSRIVAVFQPHTPSRLAAFSAGFSAVLRDADAAVVAETFSSAREGALEGGARALADASGARYARDPDDAARIAADLARPGDVVLIAGAGDIRAAGVALLALLRARAATTVS
ncbi:MAG: UDP-N-acetylmuramate--L-alanine ligase [Chloroflexi bacterium]|nr:UDP-N-acetylmuramate--L-alanine ligase [Chloroflexota bacterium]